MALSLQFASSINSEFKVLSRKQGNRAIHGMLAGMEENVIQSIDQGMYMARKIPTWSDSRSSSSLIGKVYGDIKVALVECTNECLPLETWGLAAGHRGVATCGTLCLGEKNLHGRSPSSRDVFALAYRDAERSCGGTLISADSSFEMTGFV